MRGIRSIERVGIDGGPSTEITVLAPVAVGAGIWMLITQTSTHPQAWNDHRYWPAMLAAAFVLGFLMKTSPRRVGLLLGTSGPPIRVLENAIHVKAFDVLPAVPVVVVLIGAVCVVAATAGAIGRKVLDLLAGAVASSTSVWFASASSTSSREVLVDRDEAVATSPDLLNDPGKGVGVEGRTVGGV